MTTKEKLGTRQYNINMAKKKRKKILQNNKQYKKDMISLKIKQYFDAS